jgi:capsular polysaccharide transport system permease protein
VGFSADAPTDTAWTIELAMARNNLPLSKNAPARVRLREKARVLEALAVRGMMMRYGRGNIGFLWVLLEPMLLTVGVLAMWSALKGEREHGVDVIAFVLTGYMPITLWRHMTNGGVFLLRQNSSLLYHRNITLLDVFMGRMLLEFAGATGALILVASALLALGLITAPEDYGLVILGWLLMGVLSLSFGLAICVLTEFSEIWERFITPFQYLMLPISGCFFMVDWFSIAAQEVIMLNPTVHCFEIFRAGALGSQFATHYWVWYPLVWAIVLFAVSLKGLEMVAGRLRLD